MKKVILVALLVLILVATAGCSVAKRNSETGASVSRGNDPLMQQSSADAYDYDPTAESTQTSTIEEEATWPPVMTESEASAAMQEVDKALREKWVALEQYKQDMDDPTSETELSYDGHDYEAGNIADTAIPNLIVLASNGYNDYVKNRVAEIRKYNKNFSEVGGEVPASIESRLKEVESYLTDPE